MGYARLVAKPPPAPLAATSSLKTVFAWTALLSRIRRDRPTGSDHPNVHPFKDYCDILLKESSHMQWEDIPGAHTLASKSCRLVNDTKYR